MLLEARRGGRPHILNEAVRSQRDLLQLRLLANKAGSVPPEAVDVIRRARDELRQIIAAAHEPPAPLVDVITFEPRRGRVPVLSDYPDPLRKLDERSYQGTITKMLTNHTGLNVADLRRNVIPTDSELSSFLFFPHSCAISKFAVKTDC